MSTASYQNTDDLSTNNELVFVIRLLDLFDVMPFTTTSETFHVLLLLVMLRF